MSRIYDWTLITVISLISITVHTISVNLFAPESELHEIASRATEFDGAGLADQWFEILAIWAPLIAIVGIVSWALLREYRRQTTGVTRRVPR